MGVPCVPSLMLGVEQGPQTVELVKIFQTFARAALSPQEAWEEPPD